MDVGQGLVQNSLYDRVPREPQFLIVRAGGMTETEGERPILPKPVEDSGKGLRVRRADKSRLLVMYQVRDTA